MSLTVHTSTTLAAGEAELLNFEAILKVHTQFYLFFFSLMPINY